MRFIRTTALLSFAASLLAVGCDNGDSEQVRPTWEQNAEFVVESTRLLAAAAEEEHGSIDLDGMDLYTDPLAETWTDPVYWTYTVIHAGYTPEAGSDLRPYYELNGRPSTLTVLRAHLDRNHNWGHPVLDSDPKVYIVIREDRDRVAAVVSFQTVDGERIREAFDVSTTDRATNLLSQSDMVAAPTYLPPFPLRNADETVVLGNGSEMHTYTEDEDTVDVIFADEVDGKLVHQRWERGMPFPTETITNNLETRLLRDDEVAYLDQGMAPRSTDPDPGSEDWDFLAALRESVDLQASLSILEEDLGESSATTVEGYRPWAGSWWPQAEGGLIFGYENRASFSDEIKGDIDPIRLDMDTFSEDLRDMPKETDEEKEAYNAKVEEYKAKQQELVDKLVEFYGDILSGLDGGQIVVADGNITKGEEWSYAIAELSPMDKWALYEYMQGNTNPNPFYVSAWEILNHYSPGGGSWWGHCNGWAAAAILTNEPREARTYTAGGHEFNFTTADIKGLVTESYYSQQSHFYGARYNGEDDDISDLHPDAFHRIVGFYVRDRGVPLVFDTSADDAVWNYPAYAYDMTITETTDSEASALVNINTADAETLMGLDSTMTQEIADAIVSYRLTVGPFQKVDDVLNVDEVTDEIYDAIVDLITVDAIESARKFQVSMGLIFTTDGVDEDHIDTDANAPKGFTNDYTYTLHTDEDGLVISGEWADEKKHPDFAWVPYNNPTYPSNNGSENPYLNFGSLAETLGDELIRH